MKLSPINLMLVLTVFSGIPVRTAPRVVFPLFALSLGAEPVTVGLLAATLSLLIAMFAVSAGKLTDSFGSRWALTLGSIGGVISLMVPYLMPNMIGLFIGAAINGLSTGVFEIALQNLTGHLSTQANRARNFSNYSVMVTIGNFTGPLISGLSIDHFGHAATCLYLALLALTPLVILALWGGVLPGATRRPERKKGSGNWTTLSEPGVRKVLATNALLNTGKDIFNFYMPVYMHAIGLSASIIGTVLAVNGAASFALRLFLPKLIERFKEEKLLSYAFFVGCVSLLLIPFFEHAVILGAISFIFGLSLGCSTPVITMLMFMNAPKERSGETLGLRTTVTHIVRIVGPIMFGSIGSAVGLPPIFWIDAVMLGAGGLISYPRKVLR